MIYWDSSALIKKYLMENGSDAVLQKLSADPLIVTSQLAYPEILATFARKLREKAMPAKAYQSACHSFEADWKAMTIVHLDDAILSRVRNLLARHQLRSADVVHLASALYVAERTRFPSLPFACADNRLLHAAGQEGLEGWNPLEGVG